MNVGICYLYDLSLYARLESNGSKNYGARVIKEMADRGWLEKASVRKPEGKDPEEGYPVCALTVQGQREFLDMLSEVSPKDYEYYRKNRPSPARLRSVQQKGLRSELNDARMKIMFVCAGVPVFEKDKPSLYRLIHGTDLGEESLALLEEGLFYTMKEFRKALDEEAPGTADTILGTKARGIFISRKNCLVIYPCRRGDNRIVRVSKAYELRLLKLLKPLLKRTNVERTVPALDRRTREEGTGRRVTGERYRNAPYGLILSDGDAMVYYTANGKAGSRSGEEWSAMGSAKFNWLNGQDSIYPRLFVTSCTWNGISTLDYLCHTGIEEWAEEAKERFASSPSFRMNPYDPFYPAEEILDGEPRPVIYMPVFETVELRRIKERRDSVVILTYRDMMDALSRAIQREVRFYDIETMKPAEGISGYCKDKSPEEADPEEPGKNKRPSVRRRSISLTFTEDFTAKIKEAARYRDTSVTNYIRAKIQESVAKDSGEYRRQVRENRNWKPEKSGEEEEYPEAMPEEDPWI